MEVETIKKKRDVYAAQLQELIRRRAELSQTLEETERQIIAHHGAIEALDELLASNEDPETGGEEPENQN